MRVGDVLLRLAVAPALDGRADERADAADRQKQDRGRDESDRRAAVRPVDQELDRADPCDRGTDQRQSVDGLTLRNVAGQGNSTNTVVDDGSSQEMTIDYAAGNAEAVTGGVLFNFVPKEGGNRFSGSFFGSHTNTDFQNSNYTDELAAQGLRAPNRLKNLFDYNGSAGGPIARDRVWFYSSARFQRSESYIAGLWENKNAGDLSKWLYEADLDDQTSSFLKSNTVMSRVTWQASPRNKFNVYFDNSWRYWLASLVGVSSESEQKYDFPRLWQVTGGWSSPVSNRMLIDVRGGMHKEDIFNFYDPVWAAPLEKSLNPEVSLRSSGVMEKCTFCIQRIRKGEDKARDEGRKIKDGDVVPACVGSCPARAMTFGNIADPESEVARLAKSNRATHLLEELGTKPRVIYLSKGD